MRRNRANVSIRESVKFVASVLIVASGVSRLIDETETHFTTTAFIPFIPLTGGGGFSRIDGKKTISQGVPL